MSETNNPSDSVSGSNEPSEKQSPPNRNLMNASEQTMPTPLASTPASSPVQIGPLQAGPAQTGPRVLLSEELFVGSREIHIRHGNDTYRLMITRNDKLILQK